MKQALLQRQVREVIKIL